MKRNPAIRSISICIKVAIVFVALFYIVRRFSTHAENTGLQELFSQAFPANIGAWATVLGLGVINWALEATRWRFLVSRIELISWRQSFRAVLAGVTMGVATPNRIGEFGGRIFYLDKANHIEAALLAFVGSFAQFMVTALAGLAGLLVLDPLVGNEALGGALAMKIIIAVLLTMIALFIALVSFETIRLTVLRLPFLKSWRERLSVLSTLTALDHVRLLGWSGLRYFVYSLQFYLLLLLFGVQLHWNEGFAAIAVTFFIITVVPTFAITEVLVRGTAATTVIGAIAGHEDRVLAASLALWVVNIALPALTGIVFVFRLRFFRRHEND